MRGGKEAKTPLRPTPMHSITQAARILRRAVGGQCFRLLFHAQEKGADRGGCYFVRYLGARTVLQTMTGEGYNEAPHMKSSGPVCTAVPEGAIVVAASRP